MNVNRDGIAEHQNVVDISDVASDDLTPEFRVVLVAKKRRGVRLEKIYWKLLDDIAKRRGVKRSRLIASIIEQEAENPKNIASILRGFVARTLEDERHASASQNSELFLINLLQQAPLPAFAINRQKKLSQVNVEFMQLLRMMVGNMTEKISADVVQLTLDTPTEELFSRLVDSVSTHCNYVINLDGRQRRGRIKIVAIPPSPHTMLVGYIVS